MAHLSPLENDEIKDPEILERFAHYANTRGFTPNSIRTMARRPKIVKAFMALNQAILYEGTVAEYLKMIVSYASSAASGCLYCQSHMSNLASIYQVPDEKIAAIFTFQDSELFSDAEKSAINLAIKMGMTPNQVNSNDIEWVKQHFDEDQIVELVASASLFGYLNRWNDTMSTELESYPESVTARIFNGFNSGKHGVE